MRSPSSTQWTPNKKSSQPLFLLSFYARGFVLVGKKKNNTYILQKALTTPDVFTGNRLKACLITTCRSPVLDVSFRLVVFRSTYCSDNSSSDVCVSIISDFHFCKRQDIDTSRILSQITISLIIFASLPDFNIDLTFYVPILRKSFFLGQSFRELTTWEALLLLPKRETLPDVGPASLTSFIFILFVNSITVNRKWKSTRARKGQTDGRMKGQQQSVTWPLDGGPYNNHVESFSVIYFTVHIHYKISYYLAYLVQYVLPMCTCELYCEI